MALHTIHLFAGAGGGILADLLIGHTPICAVEIEEYPRAVLLQRQLDGCLPRFPIWDDVTTFRADNPDTAGFFDRVRHIANDLCICGGFPCQDISSAGKGAGISGERSGLWAEYARIIREIRPRYAFIENSPLLTIRGLDTVLCDLAAMGYDAEWCVVGADNTGFPHGRGRIWILANSKEKRESGEYDTSKPINGHREMHIEPSSQPSILSRAVAYTEEERDVRWNRIMGATEKELHITGSACNGSRKWWPSEPDVGRTIDGVACRMDRLAAIGNGQCPQSAALAFTVLMDRISAQ